MYRAQTKSSFNGIIDEMPEVAVDNFENTGFKAYFLSHCHTDHTNGLFSEVLLEYLKKNRVFIYMSEHSAAIVRHESELKKKKSHGPCSDIMDYVQPLKIIGSTTITIKDAEREDLYITVSLIPAGHCIGSVMFLFRTLYKTVLYTGDFRIGVNSVSKYAQLHDNGDIIKLDALYIDTTFQNAEHDDFPKRSESVAVVIRHIKRWLNASTTNEVALHMSAKYGYEFVYKDVYTKLGQKVYVDGDLWELYSHLPNSVPGVTKDNTSRVHRCINRSEHQTHDRCFANKRQTSSSSSFSSSSSSSSSSHLYIHFSAYKWRGYQTDDMMIEIKSKTNRIDVCFATHCSKSEIDYFVSYLSPKKVVGFPNEYKHVSKEIISHNGMKSKSGVENGPPVKVPKLLDKSIVRQIFAD